MIKLITCDVDGTLVKEYSDEIEPELFTLIEKFYEKGVLFFATSGRQLYNLKTIFAPVDDKIGYIAENGALLIHKGEMLYKSTMEVEIAKNLANEILKKDDLELFICGENTLYIIPKERNNIDNILETTINKAKIISSFDEVEEDIVKVSFCCKDGITEELIQHFLQKYNDKFQQTISGFDWYDFMNVNTHKGSAIKVLQGILNISSEETVAFGDNFNDIEMLLDAKYSYAMEDAHNEVKKVAKYTCSNVVETLKQLYNEFFE